MQSEDSEKKKYRLSLITYELFVAESRLADEKIKLWQLEQFKMIQENLNKPDINEQVQEYAQNLANLRNSEADRLSDRAQELVPSITETLYLNQFNLFLNSIKLN